MKNISIFECMRFVLKILDFLVVSNVYVAMGVYSLTWLSMHTYQLDGLSLAFFVFFSTMFAYNFMRLMRVHPMLLEGDSKRHQNIYKLRFTLWCLCVISGFFSVFFLVAIYKPILVVLLFMASISIAYALPVYKKSGVWLRLRDLPGVKIFLIAIVWSLVTEGFPALLAGGKLNVLPLLERFLFVFAITIPFDIRDLRFDDKGLATIPLVFGVRKARWIGIIALFFAELILAYRCFFLDNFDTLGAISIYLVYELSAYLIYRSHPQLQERFFTLGVEGMSILMGLLFFLTQIL